MAAEPDGVCLECIPGFDFSGLSGMLAGKCTGDKVTMSPTDLGLPVARRRMYMFFDRRDAPSQSSLRDMLPVSRRDVNLSPEAFLTAEPTEVQRYYRKLVAVPRRVSASTLGPARAAPVPRRLASSPGVDGDLKLADVLHGGALHR